MKRAAKLAIATTLFSLTFLSGPLGAAIETPDEFLGHTVGEDRYLAPYDQVVAYLKSLGDASDRISVEVAGRSTLDNEMLVVVLSSEENQKNLPRIREIARRLANPDDLSEPEAAKLIEEGKTIALITCTIHSTEVGATQMALEFAHEVAVTEDPDMLSWLDDVVLLLMPSINPDGQVLVVDWYNKFLGTEYEGGRMPWLYHHYIGHDNNRDFYMLTQKESQAVNDVLYHRWFPQVFLDEHQMGSTGPRMFVPPQTDPVAPEVDSMVLRHADMLGTIMGLRLEEAGKKGVGRDMIFDSYWPGGTRNTAWWKNVVGLLTEVASARIATPIYIEPGELRGNRKGFPEYSRRANYLSPWAGGWWHLRDIMDYELIATRAYLEGTSRFRADLLTTFYRLGRQEIEKGKSQAPYGFIVPADQHDTVAAAAMIDLLIRHGVRVEQVESDLTIDNPNGGTSTFARGSYVIPTAQPYRPFILTMLQPQRYPEVRADVGGKIIPPYDVTSWSLPISMGVDIVRADTPLNTSSSVLRSTESPSWPGGDVSEGDGGYLIPHSADSAFVAMNRLLKQDTEVYWLQNSHEGNAVGDMYIPATEVAVGDLESLSKEAHVPVHTLNKAPEGAAWKMTPSRIGLYKPWRASMDEGWTRWVLEQYEFPFDNLVNDHIRNGQFKRKTDVLLLPDVSADIIKDGKPANTANRVAPLPPDYNGGLGKEGAEQLKHWVKKEGGIIVALDSSADYVIELFGLPVRNVLEKVESDDFYSPGSMLRMHIDNTHPVGYGMREEEAGYFASSPAFQTSLPDARFDRRVIATYPEHVDQILVSGYIKGAEKLVKRSSVIDLNVGEGRVVLIGFRAQHRAQPHRTFKLLFNALSLAGMEETTLP